jgi:hypothetical protein
MTMKTSFCVLFVCACLATAPVAAQGVTTGNDSFDSCKLALAQDVPLCIGIVTGELFLVKDLRESLRSCPPQGVIAIQAVRVVVQYMETHPAILNESFLQIVLTGMHDAWPCK